MSISSTGLIRAHGSGGGQTTTWDPDGTTWQTTWNPEEATTETTGGLTTNPPSYRMTCVTPMVASQMCHEVIDFLAIGNEKYDIRVQIVSSFFHATQQNNIVTSTESIHFRHLIKIKANNIEYLETLAHTNEGSAFSVNTTTGSITRSTGAQMVAEPNQTGILRHHINSITRGNDGIIFNITFWLDGSIGSNHFSKDSPEETTFTVIQRILWKSHLDGDIPPGE